MLAGGVLLLSSGSFNLTGLIFLIFFTSSLIDTAGLAVEASTGALLLLSFVAVALLLLLLLASLII